MLARAGDTKGAAATEAKANVATAKAKAAQDQYTDLNQAVVQEQQKAAVVQAKAEDLSKKLPTGGGGMPTGGYTLPPPPDEPKPVDKKPPEKEPPPSPPKGGDYRDTFRKAMVAKDRRQWGDARQLFQLAIQLNGQESTERITISGAGYVEPYLPEVPAWHRAEESQRLPGRARRLGFL